MAAFATTTDLASWLQVASVTSGPATLALNVASSTIRSFCGWSISQETVTETRDGTGAKSLWLPTLRLTAVASVVADGRTLTPTVDYDWTSFGKLIRHGCWPRTPRSVALVYTHGYATVPDVVKGVCLSLAARAYNNPQDAKSMSEDVGPFARSLTYTGDSPSSLSRFEMGNLGPFKLEYVG